MLIFNTEPQTEEWFAVRREGITGTDLPKILGLSRYGNALSVYFDKLGELPPDEAGEAARWGNLLEEPVAQEWAYRTGASVVPVGVMAQEEEPWMRASLDRLVTEGCPDGGAPLRCALEVKTRSAYVGDRWETGIPDDTLAQIAWGRIVSGLDHFHVAALIGGQRLVTHRYDPDPDLEAYLIAEARKVWDAVQAKEPPLSPPDSEGVLLNLLNTLWTEREGDRELDAEEATTWLRRYAEGREREAEGREMKAEAQAALVQLLRDGERAIVGGSPAFSYRAPAPGLSLPSAQLKRMQKEQGHLFDRLQREGFVVETTPAPRFNLTWKETS